MAEQRTFAGIRTSRRRVLRLTREHGLQAPGRVGRPHGPKAHDGTIRTERVDLMWGTDLTSTMTDEGQASIFVTIDHCSAECIGIHAARRATRFEALEPLRQGVRTCFGAFAEVSLPASSCGTITAASSLPTTSSVSSASSASSPRPPLFASPITAAAFIAVIDRPERFKKAASVAAYIGLTPRRYQSGEVDYSGRISKSGDAMLRACLYEAAVVLLSRVERFSALKSWGVRLAARKGFRKAAVAVARKLAVILFRIWADATKFRWSREATMAAA